MIAVTVLAICCEMACDRDPGITETAMTVSGTVTDSISGAALDSVAIAVSDSAQVLIYTVSTGTYRFTTWGSGATVYAVKDGYRTKWRQAHDGDTVDFQLVPELGRKDNKETAL